MVIRLEFLVDDLRREIRGGMKLNPIIVNAWREGLDLNLKNGIDKTYRINDMEMSIYNLFCIDNSEDLVRAIYNGTTAEDIHDVVNANCQGKSPYFTKDTNSYPYVFTTDELREILLTDIEDIAQNTLYYPYNPIFGELYKMLVVPMLDGQK